jgi:hypothetical protein
VRQPALTGGNKSNNDGFNLAKEHNLFSGAVQYLLAEYGAADPETGCDNQGRYDHDEDKVFIQIQVQSSSGCQPKVFGPVCVQTSGLLLPDTKISILRLG